VSRILAVCAISLILFSIAPAIHGQVGEPSELTETLSPQDRQQAEQQRSVLIERGAALSQELAAFTQQCGHVADTDSSLVATCRAHQTDLIAKIRQYNQDVDEFDQMVARMALAWKDQTPPAAPARTYRASGNALIGGTTWITGYNVQNADPKLVAKEREMMAQQMKLAGSQYSDGVDFNRYNYVLGIAASTDAFTDLSTRVIFDEFSNGQFSAEEQAAYDSLKGRQFGELACHSNGAMVCLAALQNKDIVADHVVLYGPQITVESLKMWDEMVRSGQVKSVQVYINRSDPVPPVSMLVGGGVLGETALSSLAMFKPPTLTSAINEISPRLTVQTFSCGNGTPTLNCHAMTAYKARVSYKPQPPLQSVPGTKLNGVGVPEPPSPSPR
jgi:hypothetical protein